MASPTPWQLLRAAIFCGIGAGALIAVLILSGCASSSTGRLLNTAVIGSGVADYVTTRQAIDQGRGREGNPILGQDAFRQAVVKSLGIAGVIGIAHLIDQQHSVMAHLIRGVSISLWSAIAVRNGRIR